MGNKKQTNDALTVYTTAGFGHAVCKCTTTQSQRQGNLVSHFCDHVAKELHLSFVDALVYKFQMYISVVIYVYIGPHTVRCVIHVWSCSKLA